MLTWFPIFAGQETLGAKDEMFRDVAINLCDYVTKYGNLDRSKLDRIVQKCPDKMAAERLKYFIDIMNKNTFEFVEEIEKFVETGDSSKQLKKDIFRIQYINGLSDFLDEDRIRERLGFTKTLYILQFDKENIESTIALIDL